MLVLICRDDSHQFVVQALDLPVGLLQLLSRVQAVSIHLRVVTLGVKPGHDARNEAVLSVSHPRDADLGRLQASARADVHSSSHIDERLLTRVVVVLWMFFADFYTPPVHYSRLSFLSIRGFDLDAQLTSIDVTLREVMGLLSFLLDDAIGLELISRLSAGLDVECNGG